MNDKIIEVRSDEERRLHARRASDRYRDGDGLARERRYEVYRAAVHMYCWGQTEGIDDWTYKQALAEAEEMLAEIERRDLEKQQKGHEAWRVP